MSSCHMLGTVASEGVRHQDHERCNQNAEATPHETGPTRHR